MAYEFKINRRVEFSETDMAGIVHYSNYFRYMESAEHAFWRSIGHSVVNKKVDPSIGWPRVHAECDYMAPLHFEDEMEVHAVVSEKKAKALTFVFRIHKTNTVPPVLVARGSVTVVCVTHEHGKMTSAKIPEDIAAKVEVAPKELF